MEDKGSVATAAVGTFILDEIVHGNRRKIRLDNVHNVPTMGLNLRSVGMTEKRGAAVSFKNERRSST